MRISVSPIVSLPCPDHLVQFDEAIPLAVRYLFQASPPISAPVRLFQFYLEPHLSPISPAFPI